MKNKGFLLSLLLHLLIFLLVVWMGWTGYHSSVLQDPVADCSIPLEIVDSAEVSMAPISKPKVAKPADQKREQDPEPPQDKESQTKGAEKKDNKKKSPPKESFQMEELDQLIDSVLPELEFEKKPPQSKPQKKSESPKKVHQGKKQKGDSDEDFMKVLKDMSANEQKGPSAETPQTDPNSSSPYGAASIGSKMAISLTDRIRRMLEGAWRVPMRAHDGGTLIVMVNLKMLPDGHVQSVQVIHSGGTPAHPAYRLAVESALRAIQSCSPLPLPKDKYSQWKSFQFRFIRQ
jgi:outer membrane biosynthesis protein TonB